jgi:hypothetical protein
MMSTKIPKTCLEEIHKIQRQFIWGDTEVKRRYHAVGWDGISVPKWMGGLGLRKLNVMNQACLMKLGWKFQTNGEDYWCRVLRGKYERNTSTTSNMIKASSSSLWKNLYEHRSIMHNFSYWSVGDGKDIDAWSEAWLEDGLYINKHINIPPHLLGLKVRELVDNEGKWNWSLLQSWMPPTLQQKIAASLPPSDDYGRDERYMAGGTAADFSVADIYNKLCGFNRENASTTWDKIWKLQVPERVRSFIWLAKHDRLLTNLRRKKMGLSHDMCLFCGNVVESTLHVLRDCPLAMTIWVRWFL